MISHGQRSQRCQQADGRRCRLGAVVHPARAPFGGLGRGNFLCAQSVGAGHRRRSRSGNESAFTKPSPSKANQVIEIEAASTTSCHGNEESSGPQSLCLANDNLRARILLRNRTLSFHTGHVGRLRQRTALRFRWHRLRDTTSAPPSAKRQRSPTVIELRPSHAPCRQRIRRSLRDRGQYGAVPDLRRQRQRSQDVDDTQLRARSRAACAVVEQEAYGKVTAPNRRWNDRPRGWQRGISARRPPADVQPPRPRYAAPTHLLRIRGKLRGRWIPCPGCSMPIRRPAAVPPAPARPPGSTA